MLYGYSSEVLKVFFSKSQERTLIVPLVILSGMFYISVSLEVHRNVAQMVYTSISIGLAKHLHQELFNQMDGIMHKWSNPHFDNFEKKSRCNMKYRIKRINTNNHK